MKPNLFKRTCWAVAGFSLLFQSGFSQSVKADFSNWPKGCSPKEVGAKVARRFVESPFQNFGRPNPPKSITYPEVCAWYGALTFAKETNNKKLKSDLVNRFEPLLGEKASMIPVPDHVDYTVFGAVPLELYMQTGGKKYLDMGKDIADKQWGRLKGNVLLRSRMFTTTWV